MLKNQQCLLSQLLGSVLWHRKNPSKRRACNVVPDSMIDSFGRSIQVAATAYILLLVEDYLLIYKMTSSSTFAQISSGLPNTWPGSSGASVKSMSMVATSLSNGCIFVSRSDIYSVGIYVILPAGEFDPSGGIVLSSDSTHNNAGLFQIIVTKSDDLTNLLTCASTAGLLVNSVVFFTSTTGSSFGGIITCATTCTRYYIHKVLSPTTFSISTAPSSTTPMNLASNSFSIIMDIIDHRAPIVPYVPDAIIGFRSNDRTFFAIASSKRNFYCKVITCTVPSTITCDTTHNMIAADSVLFSEPASCGLIPDTVYFVVSAPTATTLTVSRTKGGAAVTLTGSTLTGLSMKVSTVRKLLVYENVKHSGWRLASSIGSMLTIDEVTDMQSLQYHGKTLLVVSRWRTGTLSSRVIYSFFLEWNNKQSKFTISQRAYHNFNDGAKKVRILQPFINWRHAGEIYPHSSQSDAAFGSSLGVSLDSVLVGAPLFEEAAEYQISVTSSTTTAFKCTPQATCALDLVQQNAVTFSFSSAPFGGVQADIMYAIFVYCSIIRMFLWLTKT